jgi:hypothetical protein
MRCKKETGYEREYHCEELPRDTGEKGNRNESVNWR